MPVDDRNADVRSSNHRPRHAEPEAGDPTAVIPRVVDAGTEKAATPRPDETAVIPRVPAAVPDQPKVDWWGRPVAAGAGEPPAAARTKATTQAPATDPPAATGAMAGTAAPTRKPTRPASGRGTGPAVTATDPADDERTVGLTLPSQAPEDPATAVIPRVPEPSPGPTRAGTPAPRQRTAPEAARATAAVPVPPITPVPPKASTPPRSPDTDSRARTPADRAVPDANDDAKPDAGGLPHLKDDMTTVMPVAGDPVADTTLFSAVRPPQPRPDDAEEAPAERPGSRWGPHIVALRPLRSREGYRSVHSNLTRTTSGSVVRATARTVGEVLITLGLVVLLFAAYEVWGKTAIVDAHQQTLGGRLNKEWDSPGTPGAPEPSTSRMNDAGVPPGYAIARLYIPKLKKQWVVVQGVTPDDIRFAPGHYPGTAMPGQVGNFAVAGHRIPAIFWDLDQMRSGNKIVVETRTTWYVYQVSQVEIVSPHAVQVVAPVPDHPDANPTKDDRWLTLTTCNPKWDNYQRLIVHARLVSSQSRSAGRPTALGG